MLVRFGHYTFFVHRNLRLIYSKMHARNNVGSFGLAQCILYKTFTNLNFCHIGDGRQPKNIYQITINVYETCMPGCLCSTNAVYKFSFLLYKSCHLSLSSESSIYNEIVVCKSNRNEFKFNSFVPTKIKNRNYATKNSISN